MLLRGESSMQLSVFGIHVMIFVSRVRVLFCTLWRWSCNTCMSADCLNEQPFDSTSSISGDIWINSCLVFHHFVDNSLIVVSECMVVSHCPAEENNNTQNMQHAICCQAVLYARWSYHMCISSGNHCMRAHCKQFHIQLTTGLNPSMYEYGMTSTMQHTQQCAWQWMNRCDVLNYEGEWYQWNENGKLLNCKSVHETWKHE